MRIIGEKSLSTYVKVLLDMIFIGGIGIFISLPKSLEWYLDYAQLFVDKKTYYFLLFLLYTSGFFALLIVYEIRKIFTTLNKKTPFVMRNVLSLYRMGISSFIISFLYIFKILFFNSILTMIIVMIFIIAGFFSIILAEVFRQAVEAKEENDFTI